MRKIIFCAVVSVCLLTACADGTAKLKITEGDHIDSSVLVEVKVPSVFEEVDIAFPFYRLTNQFEGPEVSEYTVGVDADLEGTNTEYLNGAKVTVTTNLLSDYINDDYKNGINTHSMLSGVDIDPEKVAEAAEKCEGCYVIGLCFYYSGDIDGDVSVRRLYISGLDLEFEFDKFVISRTEYKEEVKAGDLEHPIQQEGSLNPMNLWHSIDSDYYACISGVAAEEILGIELISLDESVRVIPESEYDKRGLENSYKSQEFSRGDKIEDDMFYYEFAKEYLSGLADTMVASLAIRIKTASETYLLPYYPSVAVLGQYLLLREFDK